VKQNKFKDFFNFKKRKEAKKAAVAAKKSTDVVPEIAEQTKPVVNENALPQTPSIIKNLPADYKERQTLGSSVKKTEKENDKKDMADMSEASEDTQFKNDSKIKIWFYGVIKEFKRIAWSKKGQNIKDFFIIIIVVVVLAFFFLGIDTLLKVIGAL